MKDAVVVLARGEGIDEPLCTRFMLPVFRIHYILGGSKRWKYTALYHLVSELDPCHCSATSDLLLLVS